MLDQFNRSLLADIEWESMYDFEDGNLVPLFYEPALSRTVLYQRITGYFSANVLDLASRGLNGLLANGGSMQLIVGCTLGPDEINQIEHGYELREVVAGRLVREIEATESDTLLSYERLGWLAWMIANDHLDIKVAIPTDGNGRIIKGSGLFHPKAGLLTDAVGDKLAFHGSLNETEAGWLRNCESLTVHCSWEGAKSRSVVHRIEQRFAELWSDKSKFAKVMPVPDAVRGSLLKFLPDSDTFVYPEPQRTPQRVVEPGIKEAEVPENSAAGQGSAMVEPRTAAWQRIVEAATGSSGPDFAVQTSAIEPWPHQLRAYKRMIDSWPFRLLIADEVGLGKTIEAGMILRYLWISKRATRILILAPAGVMRQWQSELYEKFNLVVPFYDGAKLVFPTFHGRIIEDRSIDRKDWTNTAFVIASSHLMRRRDRTEELVSAQRWDLIVLDEAHHARRRGSGVGRQRGPNQLLSLMQRLRDQTRGMLLLTATPMQVQAGELYDLFSLLGMPRGWDEQVFFDYFAKLNANPDENQLHALSKLFQVVEDQFSGLPEHEIKGVQERFRLSGIAMRRIMKAVRDRHSSIPLGMLQNNERKAALEILRRGSPIRSLMSRHTRDLLRTYYRKGLLAAKLAVRQVQDVSIEMHSRERELYEMVEDYITDVWQSASADRRNAVGFVLTVYRRRMASSFASLRKTLEKRLEAKQYTTHVEEEADEDIQSVDETLDEVLGPDELRELRQQALDVEEQDRLLELIAATKQLRADTKTVRLIEEIRSITTAGYSSVLVFTEYTDTMDYLRDQLPTALDLPIGCFSGRGGEYRDNSGGWHACSKDEIKRRLRAGQIQLLLCTDAAGEGLNLQYCGALINYDLPWNPMKVEQRIGRIDRIGQVMDTIQIRNLAYSDTIEADIYFALSERINLFQGLVGKLQPILARLPKQIESAVLSPQTDGEIVRSQLLSALDADIARAESEGFDIDSVSDVDLEIPDLESSKVGPGDIDALLRDPAMVPPGVECRPMDAGTYAIRFPGQTDEVRITALPALFDEHVENMQLMGLDGEAYRRLVSRVSISATSNATSED